LPLDTPGVVLSFAYYGRDNPGTSGPSAAKITFAYYGRDNRTGLGGPPGP